MIQDFSKYDAAKDPMNYGVTVPDLAVDIHECLTTGVIKDTGYPVEYTKETDVNAVGSYLKDPIDIAQAQINLGKSFAQVGGDISEGQPAGE